MEAVCCRDGSPTSNFGKPRALFQRNHAANRTMLGNTGWSGPSENLTSIAGMPSPVETVSGQIFASENWQSPRHPFVGSCISCCMGPPCFLSGL